jgi:hypothetical protein
MVIHMNPRPGPSDIQLAPNHHASHPGFSGISGFVAAVSFLFGRDRAARLAVDLAVCGSAITSSTSVAGPASQPERPRLSGPR